MTVFQILALFLIALLLMLTVKEFGRRRSKAFSLLWSLIWILAASAIAMPDWTNRVARGVGIGRGADLVLYGFAISFLLSFLYTQAKFFRLESDLTRIVRHLALREGLEQDSANDAGNKGGNR